MRLGTVLHCELDLVLELEWVEAANWGLECGVGILELYLLDVVEVLYWFFLWDEFFIGVGVLVFWILRVGIVSIDRMICFKCEILFILWRNIFFRQKFSIFEPF